MGEVYKSNGNVFQDILVQAIDDGIDIGDKKEFKRIFGDFKYLLGNILDNPVDVVYLDFDIIKDDNLYKVVGNNMLSALWLSGIFVDGIYSAINGDEILIDDVEYMYDKKKRKLTYKIIDE